MSLYDATYAACVALLRGEAVSTPEAYAEPVPGTPAGSSYHVEAVAEDGAVVHVRAWSLGVVDMPWGLDRESIYTDDPSAFAAAYGLVLTVGPEAVAAALGQPR